MSLEIKDGLSPTPFDDVFKTATEKMGHLLITVIELMFNVKAELVDLEEIQHIANERYLIDTTQTKVSKRFTDNVFKIAGNYYHIECQSTEDGSILFRLSEYNIRIALDNAEEINPGNSIRINLPNSGLINLKSSSNSPKFSEMKIVYQYSDQKIIMPVPVMNIQAFTTDDIYNNGLYFLIPFYAIRYEERLRKISDSKDPEYVKIYSELKTYFDRLLEACESKTISENETRQIAELSKIILGHISRKLIPDLRERMVSIVGGQVLELQEDRWLKQGYEQGEKQGFVNGEKQGFANGEKQGFVKGEIQGRDSLLYSLVIDNVLSVSDAAARANKNEEQFIKDMKAYIEEHRKTASETQP